MNKQVQQGVNVILKVDGVPVGGQINTNLTRSQSSIDITNKINGEWQQNLSGLKTWSINCSGVYIRSQEALEALEDAFMNNKEIEALIDLGMYLYKGYCYITDFPTGAVYNNQYRYTITLLGNGALEKQ